MSEVKQTDSNNRAAKVAKTRENGDASTDSKYGWEEVHQDLEKDIYSGVYGGANSAYFGLAELRAKVNMEDYHKKKSADEFLLEALDAHIKNPHTHRRWSDIVTLDPMGMYATRPTMSATTAQMVIPELNDIEPDGNIVNPDGSFNIMKIAVDYVWNLPGLSSRLGFEEDAVRKALYKYTQNDRVMNPKYRSFLPPVGGVTVYIFGDPRLLSKPTTEVAVRVHDACCGSDVFGTDICTCRPYLVFAVRGCVDCAKRGGVGIVAYYQKEGRSLGEVTKFRVYNARKRQVGGDRPEKYFYQTESIAGIRDARFQEMMPDVLLWLGITRIDWLLSMSSDKYDAIVGAGIEVMQRTALPDQFVPANAQVEINAKISAGYHSDSIQSREIIHELRSLEMIRQRCGEVFAMAEQGKSKHFSLHMDKLDSAVDLVVDVTRNAYPDLQIPYHSRWRHFPAADLKELTNTWHCDEVERARRMIDLVTVSVLMDAGSGPDWKYIDSHGQTWVRSEGLAVATLNMFREGLFSSDVAVPHRVNAHGLKALNFNDFSRGFQVSNTNPMAGVKGRHKLLHRLGDALKAHPEFFGQELRRPGHLVDYVLSHAKDHRVSIRVLWRAVIEGLESIWPNTLSGIRRGDIWVYNPLKKVGEVGSDMVPFHKLSQWLTMSLLEPIENLGIKFDDMSLLTGLAEYRNGGLFVDTGVLEIKNKEISELVFDVGAELVVEWRALTVCLLDRLAARLRQKMNLNDEQMPLPKVLQGGTWTAGRAIANKKRANGVPPIQIRSDGSVF